PGTRDALDKIVVITGTAADTRFKSYRLEYRPAGTTTWVSPPLASSSTPVINGTLGSWDTRSVPDGEDDLQLTVLNTLGLTGVVTDRVIVDNEAPFVDESSPVEVKSDKGGDVFTTRRQAHLYIPPYTLSDNAVVTIDSVATSTLAAPLPL